MNDSFTGKSYNPVAAIRTYIQLVCTDEKIPPIDTVLIIKNQGINS
jgi:hypothetical protein